MSVTSRRGIALLGGLLWALLAGMPAMADDTELFVYDSSVLAAKPNILFIFDTSGSMDTTVESQENYDPATTYAGACDPSRLYWRSASWLGSGDPPTCDTSRWFNKSVFMCKAGLDAFGTNAGRWTDYFAEYDPGTRKRWEGLNQNDKSFYVECESDAGVDGNLGADPTKVWAQNGDASNPWTSTRAKRIGWSWSWLDTVYDANYLNWYYGPTGPSTRSKVMKDVATGLVGSINNVNIGLMRYNTDQGGRLVHAVEDVATNRSTIIDAINSLPANGWTPLSETLYEAGLYFMGRQPYYANWDVPDDIGIGVNGTYQSPIQYACQKNYIVYLTDGEPTQDTDADSKILALKDESGNSFSDLVGTMCDAETYPPGFSPSGGDCLDELAEFLHKGDLSASLPGTQSVTTYTVGFTVDLPILKDTAERGGGEYYTADNTATLSQALTNIVTSILRTQTTFTAPTVSVDSFNQTRHLNDVFVTVFQPSSTVHWPGNLKKYRLRPSDATIVDQNDLAAVDPVTGFFKDESQSWWTLAPDGPNVILGGAANQLPSPATRNVYTYLGATDLTAASNAVTTANSSITDAMLNIGNPGDPAHDDVINFIRGVDIADSNQNNSTTDARNQVGDPLHSQPVSMMYGGTPGSPDPNDAVIYFATNDGYLHAVDPSTGRELWSFVPPEFLGDQVALLKNPTSTTKHYGIDGSLRLQVYANNDGIIDPSAGEKVYLFFGMRRGGTFYYGLDVSDPAAPKLLWRLNAGDLPGVGQTWSNPVPTKITINDPAENSKHLVVVFGGGYDQTQDNYSTSTDSLGNDVYIVDSESGALLWHGGETGATKNFAKMQYSIPADIKVIDLDGDGYADRMYAADMGGQVWRFDIFNGQAPATLVNGGVIAQLGAAGLSSPTNADTRRFYYSPDVALVSGDSQSFIHIGIGSGYRAHPNSTDNQDRFYALRDYAPFDQLSQTAFDAKTPVTEGDLTDVTTDANATVATDSPGWMLQLGAGEKVLAEARTFNNQVYFTTFTPGAAPDANDCVPRLGTNKLYIMSLFNGSPVTNLDGSVDDSTLTLTDRSKEFHGSISSEVVFMFPSADNPDTCVGDECTPPPVACVDLFCAPTNFFNGPRRTIWRDDTLDR